MLTRRLLTKAACTFASAALTAAVAACGASGGGQPANASMITVSDQQCGGTWHLTRPGWYTFEINNQGVNGAEIDLTNPANGAVYAEIENSGPGTITPMALNVGSGKYAFLCLFSDSNPQAGPTVTVAGDARGTQAVLPITYNDLLPLATKYQKDLEAGIKVLAAETDTLQAAVKSGNLTAAKKDWLTAHFQYETLGDAYGAFGDYDTEIDGRADAFGVNSSQWTGFYRLEYGLWHGQSVTELHRGCPDTRQRRARAARLVAVPEDSPDRPRTARPRANRERPGVPAHRARRLWQRHHPREHGGQHPGVPLPAQPAEAAGRAARLRAAPGLRRPQHAAEPAREGTPPQRMVGARIRTLHADPRAD